MLRKADDGRGVRLRLVAHNHGVVSVDEVCHDDVQRTRVAFFACRAVRVNATPQAAFSITGVAVHFCRWNPPDLRCSRHHLLDVGSSNRAGSDRRVCWGRIEAGAVSRRERAALAAIEASEAQRSRISRELHDEMGQELTALVLVLKSLGDAVDEEAVRGRLRRLQRAATRMSEDMHHIALQLRPGALNENGLEAALSNDIEEWSKRYDVGADFQSVGLRNRAISAGH